MPQLDKVTFLSQYFWLSFFFLGFYYMISKFYLPKISRILALRQKKIGFSEHAIRYLQEENDKIKENSEVLLSEAQESSKSLFSKVFSRTTNWLHDNATAITKTQYENINSSYLNLVGKTLLSNNMVFYHAQTKLPDILKFKSLLNNLQSRTMKTEEYFSTSHQSAEQTKKHKKNKK